MMCGIFILQTIHLHEELRDDHKELFHKHSRKFPFKFCENVCHFQILRQ